MNAPTPATLRQKVVDRLLEHGITPTRQRVEIGLCLFDGANKHVTADQLHERVNHSASEASKATIYNTLSLFARNGLVREVVIDPTRQIYDTNTSEHHHIFNVDTGQIMDVLPGQLTLEGVSELDDNLEIEGVDIIIRVRTKTMSH